MQNVITVGGVTLNIASNELPFGNNFTQLAAKLIKYEGVKEVLAHVVCTNDSREPGRTYSVYYSMAGKMEGCNTTN